MEDQNKKEILCFESSGKTYAAEFENIVEICFDTHLHSIPCQPSYFCGVYHYKGMVVPVVQLEEEKIPEGRPPVLLILRSGVYQFGIALLKEPYIQAVDEAERTADAARRLSAGRPREKAIYTHQDKIILLLDMEKTAENLVACP